MEWMEKDSCVPETLETVKGKEHPAEKHCRTAPLLSVILPKIQKFTRSQLEIFLCFIF